MPSLLVWHGGLSPFFPRITFAVSWLDSKKEKTVRAKCFSKSCNLKGEDNVNYLEQCHDLRKAAETLTGSCKPLEETCSSVACSAQDNENRL